MGTTAGLNTSLDTWITYPYEENGQHFTVVQPKALPKKDDLREDGPADSMNRNGRYVIPINRFRDVVLVPSITADMFVQQRREIQFRNGDIVIATFPRSGTTWTEQLVLLMLNKGDPSHLNTVDKNAYDPQYPNRLGKVFFDYLYHKNPAGNIAAPWGKSSGKDVMMRAKDLEKIPFRRVIKTHHRAPMMIGMGEAQRHLDRMEPPPFTVDNVKFLWVVRDPKDVAMSMLRINTTNYEKHGVPLPAFLKIFLEGKANRGSWADHTREWKQLSEQHPESVLPLSFEDNKKHPLRAARRIAQFLDISLTEDELANCVKWSSFDAMKEMAKGGTYQHILSGKVGGWQESMSDDVIAAFNSMASDPSLGEYGRRYIYNPNKGEHASRPTP